jgi:L-alanine-DL-glutamate epimerase-like enolase superfamily enzyme
VYDRIASLKTTAVGLPFRRRYLTATGSLDRREMIIVRVRSKDGAVGYGDAIPLNLRGGRGLAEIQADLEQICSPMIVGLELGESPLPAIGGVLATCRATGAGPQALSGVEIALLDLVGRMQGAPIWRLLGAGSHQPVECNGTLGADEPVAAGEIAAEFTEAGFKTLKIKVGTDEDVDRVVAVRAACGSEIGLRVDANGFWSVPEAIDRLRALEPIGIELAEQPCGTLEQLAEVRSESNIPLVADESVNTVAEAEAALRLGACDAATLKLAKVGGIGAALGIAGIAPSYLSSALDSAIGITAAAHAAQTLPSRDFTTGLAHGLATSGLFTDNVADDASLRGPSISLSDRPGLGIDIDEDAVERLRL